VYCMGCNKSSRQAPVVCLAWHTTADPQLSGQTLSLHVGAVRHLISHMQSSALHPESYQQLGNPPQLPAAAATILFQPAGPHHRRPLVVLHPQLQTAETVAGHAQVMTVA
jgi:hypothetical protein